MIDAFVAVVRRMTRWEIAAAALILSGPYVAYVALLIGAGAGEPLIGVAIALAYFVVMAVAVAVAVAVRVVLRRRFRALVEAQPDVGVIHSGSAEHRVIVAATDLSGFALRAFGARTGSTWVRDVLAYRATGGRLDFDTLSAALRSEDAAASSLLIGAPIPRDLIALMRVLSEQPGTKRDVSAILRYLARPGGKLNIGKDDQVLLAERLILAGHEDDAGRLVARWSTDGIRPRMLTADLLNPLTIDKVPDELAMQRWAGAFNQVFRPYGLEPVTLNDEGLTPFDRLHAESAETRTGGPLISVIMTCYRPGPELLTAVRSVVSQSWKNWELLLIDDASGPEFAQILEQAAATDRRVRLLRGAENAGTYVRRNDALAAANGEFVTMHDSDDWMHPRRLERQVDEMLEAPELIAVLSTSLRVTESLRFTQPRGTNLRPAETSIMFRRERALEKVGYYDEVRKAADSEYRLRLEAAFGQSVPTLDTGGPLTLVRYLPQSLSGSEIGDGWMHPARIAYRSAAGLWHERIRSGEASPKLAHPMTERPFPVPEHLLGRVADERVLDLVVVLDGRAKANPAGHLERVADELAEAVASGATIGVMHLDSVSADTQLGIFPHSLQELVSSGRVVRVIPGERVRAATVIVRNASVLHGHPVARLDVVAERTVIVQDDRSGRDRPGRDFTPASVRVIATRMFGARVDCVVVDDVVDLLSLTESVVEVPQQDPVEEAARVELQGIAPPRVIPTEPTGWAAEHVTILEFVRSALTLEPGAVVLEMGSGFSTMWLALAKSAHEGAWRHVALEHDERFLRETGELLREQGVADLAEVRSAPLRPIEIDRERYSWYDTTSLEDLDGVALMLVDGPPRHVRIGSRFPAFPLVEPRLADGALILLDDVDREEEAITVDLWRTWLGGRGQLTAERVVGRTSFVRFRRSAH